ncbi:hypothetical protein ES705_12642 [subsurface metagenome]
MIKDRRDEDYNKSHWEAPTVDQGNIRWIDSPE